MAKNKNMARHQLVLNLDDPYQKALNDHLTKNTNFSGYLKRLLMMDYEKTLQPMQQQTTIIQEQQYAPPRPIQVQEEQSTIEDFEFDDNMIALIT